MTDPISDMLARIRNAQVALRTDVEVPHSRIKESIAAILKREGYIADFAAEGAPGKRLKLKLKYEGKKGVIEGMRRISRPGLRHFVGATALPRVRGGMGVAILSTSQGVMTSMQARKNRVGGEVLCYVW